MLDTSGLVDFQNVDGNIAFSATLAALNAALANGLQFRLGDQSALNAVVLVVDDNGNFGEDLPLNQSRAFPIRVDIIPFPAF